LDCSSSNCLDCHLDDNSTAIYQWTDVAGTAGVQDTELTLVGTIDAAMTTAELATAITIV